MATKEQIGTMRERVTLQNVTEVQSTSGYAAETWATAGIVWAEVTYRILPSGEEQMADRKTAVQVVNFRIRTRGDVTEKTRILYRGEYFDIVAIEYTPAREFMVLQGEKRE